MAVVSRNISLKKYNTFAVDVNSNYFASFITDQELAEILTFCSNNNLDWYVLGMGANVIFKSDYQGCVIHPIGSDISFEDDLIIADAGVEWDEFVAFCVGAGFYGLENLSLIPSSVGAAPVQNIGAYGSEVKDCLEWVEYMDCQTLQVVRVFNKECKFGYRESIFKHELKGRAIILRVAFRLKREGVLRTDYGDVKKRVEELGGETLKNVRQAIIEIRKSKLPCVEELPNAGSFFKNPVVSRDVADKLATENPNMPYYPVERGVKLAAGWLIEQSGWKGKVVGKVGVHQKQALVICNVGGASGDDIIEFSELVIQSVKEKFSITLEREVNIV